MNGESLLYQRRHQQKELESRCLSTELNIKPGDRGKSVESRNIHFLSPGPKQPALSNQQGNPLNFKFSNTDNKPNNYKDLDNKTFNKNNPNPYSAKGYIQSTSTNPSIDHQNILQKGLSNTN